MSDHLILFVYIGANYYHISILLQLPEQSTTTTEATTVTTTTEESTTQTTQEPESTTTEVSTTTQEPSTTTQEPTTTGTSTTTQEPSTTTSEPATTESAPEQQGNSSCPETRPGQNAYVCPTNFKRHPENCDQFYQCTEQPDNYNWEIVVFSCPNNTVFSEQECKCVRPNSGDSCSGGSTRSFDVRFDPEGRRNSVRLNKILKNE